MEDLNIIGAAVEDRYISAGIVNFADRQVVPNTLHRKRVDPAASADEIIKIWAECFKEVLQLKTSNNIRIGIGIPNLIDYDAGIYLANDPVRYGCFYNQNIKLLLGKELGIDPANIRIQNVDACFFQGEVFAGAARGYQKSFGITLGMGLGTARYVDGIVEDANLWKSPFKNSTAEEYLSLRWLLNRFYELSGTKVNDLPEMKSLYPDPFVEQTFAEFGKNLGEFIVETVKNERPEMVCIGGQMESSNRFFFDIAVEEVRQKGINTPIIKAILGEKAYVIGTASIWSESVLLHT